MTVGLREPISSIATLLVAAAMRLDRIVALASFRLPGDFLAALITAVALFLAPFRAPELARWMGELGWLGWFVLLGGAIIVMLGALAIAVFHSVCDGWDDETLPDELRVYGGEDHA